MHTVVVEGDIDIRDNVAEVAGEVEAEIQGGGGAISDDQPDPAAPEWGTETDAADAADEPPDKSPAAEPQGLGGGALEQLLDARRL